MKHVELPAEHWNHLPTTNPIESMFATGSCGSGSRRGPTHAARGSPWRIGCCSLPSSPGGDGHERLPLVRAGVRFQDGVRVERDEAQVAVLTNKRASKKEAREKVAA